MHALHAWRICPCYTSNHFAYYGIAKSKALLSLMMFCHWKLKLYLLYAMVGKLRCRSTVTKLQLPF